jgi:hypothetical protein
MDIDKGIYLENLDLLIPWNTPIQQIANFGDPEIRNQPGGRSDVVWKGSKVFGGLTLDLTAIFGTGFFYRSKLRHIFSYLDSESSITQLKNYFDHHINSKHKFRQHKDLTFDYSWRSDTCKVVVGTGDRFGKFYFLKINR